MNPKLDLITSPPAIAIADIVRKMKAEGKMVAGLQTGEPMFATPSYIKDAATDALRKDHTHYVSSQGIPELRKSISSFYLDDFGFKQKPENILITAGASQGIYCILQAVLEKGDEVLIIDPAWPQYANMAVLAGASVKRVSTFSTQGRLTAELLKKNITSRTKLAILNNPSNPAGVIYSKAEMEEFIRILKKHKIYILADEVYNRLTYVKKFTSILQCSEYKGYKDSIFYVNSFSKTFAMTGWRVGYSFLPPKILPAVLKVSQNSITNVSSFSQYAAAKALDLRKLHEQEFMMMNEEYRRRYLLLLELFTELKIDFIKPEGAFYFFINAHTDSLAYAKKLINKYWIAVVPGAAYGKDFSQYYRISFAVDEYSFNTFVDWLKKEHI